MLKGDVWYEFFSGSAVQRWLGKCFCCFGFLKYFVLGFWREVSGIFYILGFFLGGSLFFIGEDLGKDWEIRFVLGGIVLVFFGGFCFQLCGFGFAVGILRRKVCLFVIGLLGNVFRELVSMIVVSRCLYLGRFRSLGDKEV